MTVNRGRSVRAWVRLGACLVFAVVLAASSRPAGAGSPNPFTQEAVQRGVDYTVKGTSTGGRGDGDGVAFADLDGDGDPDIVVTGRADGQVGLYENNGSGYFTSRTALSGIPALIGRAGVVALDYDGDGDLDLYFTDFIAANVLMRNDGNFQFVNVSASAGVNDPRHSTGAAVADFNGDGWLDLHVPNYGTPPDIPEEDRLYRNLGNGTFVDVASSNGVADPWRGWQSVFFDMDWDGDADLYVSNDKRWSTETEMHNRLYENVGGAFQDISSNSGTDVNIFSMGVAVGDFNGNGLQDLYCTNIALVEPNVLFINKGGGAFAEQAAEAGVGGFGYGWGTLFFDYDNDGDQDLYVCNLAEANQLLVQDGPWPCTDMGKLLGVASSSSSYAVAVADIDNDGDLDLMLQNVGEKIRLYINHEGETRRWLKFDIVGQGHNRFAVGAYVRVRTGSQWQYREVIAGSNFKSQNDLVLHFGMGDVQVADEAEVHWPGGDSRSFHNVETNQTWRIIPPDALGDCDGDGDVGLDEHSGFVACVTGPEGEYAGPDCNCFDFDDDDDNDLKDFAGFQDRFST